MSNKLWLTAGAITPVASLIAVLTFKGIMGYMDGNRNNTPGNDDNYSGYEIDQCAAVKEQLKSTMDVARYFEKALSLCETKRDIFEEMAQQCVAEKLEVKNDIR
jgi:hypothetical protein